MKFLNKLHVLWILSSLPAIAFATASEYSPLVGIPGISGAAGMESYLNTLYALSISIAALLAVIKIIIAGVKYMLSDVVTSKSAAIKDIQGSLLGVIIIVMAWVILYVINPNILNTEIFLENPVIPANPSVAKRTIDEHRKAIEDTPGGIVRQRGPDGRSTTEFTNDCTSIGGMITPNGSACLFNANACNRNASQICCNGNFNTAAYSPEFSYCQEPAANRNFRTLRCTCTNFSPLDSSCISYNCDGANESCTSGRNFFGFGRPTPGAVVATTTGQILCRVDA